MVDCPDLAAAAGGEPSAAIREHLASCAACRPLAALVEERRLRHDARVRQEECARFEMLLAARDEGELEPANAELLDEHLRRCAACTELAVTLPPAGESDDSDALASGALPGVSPAAYALGREVARGGMGRIFDAVDVRIGRRVAVKELLGKSPALAARFEREARVTARLQHPGIVPIYEIGTWPDGTPFYAMRMVEGRTLRDTMRDHAKLGDRLALLPAVIAAADAVAFAHGRRVIHRDLTPSNILVGAYGDTVVIDWGLAKDLDAADKEPPATPAHPDAGASGELTGAGAVIGTAAYMPPEQANADAVDERADVYALGAILYHLLAGAPPYRAASTEELLRSVKQGPPRPLELIAPGVSRDLVSIVAKAMARDPAARYPSARELADELKRFQTGRMVEAHAYTTLERMARFVVRNRAPLTVTAIGVIALGVVGGLAVSRVYRERTAAARTVTTLLEENGRTELLSGAPLRALAFLAEAYQRGDSSPELRYMLAGAMREIDSIDATLDCGDDVRMIDVSPDGVHFAAACRDIGKIWRLADHALVATLGPFPRGFDGIRYSHDGRTLVSEGLDGNARVFDAATGELRERFEHAANTRITRASFTPDDRLLVTTGFDGWARVWDLTTQTQVRAFAAGQLGLVGVHGTLTPDGKMLLTVTLGGAGTGWDIATGAKLGQLEHGSQILGGDVSPDSALACTAGVDRRVKVWDLNARAVKWTLAGHSDVVWKCVFSPDSKRLVTSGNDGTAKEWDLETGSLVTSVTAGDIVWSVTWAPDGQRIATNSLDGSLKVWEASTGALLASHDDLFGGKTARFSLDGARLITARGDGRIRIWSEPGGVLRRELAPPPGAKLGGATGDGQRMVITRTWGNVEVWDTTTGRPLAHAPLGEPFALSDDDRWLAARAGERVLVIDLRDGHTAATLPIDGPASLALDGGGQHLVATSAVGAPVVWDVATARPIATLDGATFAILDHAGDRALGWRDGAAPTLWELGGNAGPRALTTLATTGPVRAIGFSRDGTRVAIHQGGGDAGSRVAAVWTDDGRLLVSERVANDSARFDPDGALLTTVGPDNVIRVLRVADGEVIAQFVGEHLSRAQASADGKLVVAIDKLGASMLVLSAVDGRIVAQRPILHPPLTTTEDTFVLPDAAAWWAGSGADASIITASGNLSVWDAHIETRATDQIERTAHEHMPWRVADGRLELLSGHVHGRVTRAQLPAGGVRVAVAIREVPRMPSAMSWTSTMSRLYAQTVTTDSLGEFEVGNMVPGEYTLIARSDSPASASAATALRVSDLESEVTIELDRDAAIAGVVLDTAGKPVPGARVVATCATQPVDTGAAISRGDGGFEIAPLAGGCAYEVEAAAGHTHVELRDGHSRATDVTLRAGP